MNPESSYTRGDVAADHQVSYTALTVTEDKPTVAKAIIAGVSTLTGTIITAMADNNGITATEWVTIVSATIVAALSVYAVTNKRS